MGSWKVETRSFLAQLGSISHGKFSYCITANNTHDTYLRFGKHVVKSKNLQTTKTNQVKPSSAYHVNLLGISVNGVKLNITKTDLAVRKDGSRGCIIDAVEPEAIFLFREFEGKNVFCLSMLSDDSKTIIGAYQQMKQKFVYDTKARMLSFGPEDCEKNG
ncbi:hypothetical protein NC651_000290 [Populus alba x Populus x berolinensis]|nr:hypothetical protein NC651_000290 [Populus alba x Populus x berolinensis]